MKSRKDFRTVREWEEYLRTHFSGLAMQGLLSHEGWTERMANEANSTFVKQVAQASVIAADALIEALNKPEQ